MSHIDAALRRAVQGASAVRDAGEAAGSAVPWSFDADIATAPAAVSAAELQLRIGPSLLESAPAVRGFKPVWRERLATGPARNGPLVEQFRRLAATLHHAQSANNLRIVMVTSAAAGDGKTLTALNLAIVLSESYLRRVLLVDADLRRPSLGDVTDVSGCGGLSAALKAPVEEKVTVVRVTERLTLLPAGEPDPDPLGGLSSARMRHILDDAAAGFDWVVLDAPPVGPLADTNLLAEMADGTLFVVRAGATPAPLVQRGIEALGRERILGVVLNGIERLATSSYAAYYNDEPRG